MKESVSYVASDSEEETIPGTCQQVSYELPDGEVITVGDERFMCTEALFQPHLIGEYFTEC